MWIEFIYDNYKRVIVKAIYQSIDLAKEKASLNSFLVYLDGDELYDIEKSIDNKGTFELLIYSIHNERWC